MKYIFIFFLLLFPLNVSAIQLDDYQIKYLNYAYKYGNSITYMGQGWGETIASIILQESFAGHKKFTDNGIIIGDKNNQGKPKSLGIMQVQLPAAKDVGRWYPEVFKDKFGDRNPSDEELLIALLIDYRFNIHIGTHYFLKMLEIKQNWRQAILAYNRGANNNGIDYNGYVNKVLNWRLNTVLKLIKEDKI